jgi:phosphopantetheinyl transferase
MGNIPQVTHTDRNAVTITLHDHLADHHFMGTPVLPAVESMEILAAEALTVDADTPVLHLADAEFNKFLPLDLNRETMEAYVQLDPAGEDRIQATLVTRTQSAKTHITRTKDHACVTFGSTADHSYPTPLDVAAAPEGICKTVESDRIYRELVPFGPAYRNIAAPVRLTDDGALALIQCPDLPCCTDTRHLGSPFALDAAFHAACVWGQHQVHKVAFPVAVDQRLILRPTEANGTYYARIIPIQTGPEVLVFDIWLLDLSGRIYEVARGVRMRDVSGGRLKPPPWIRRTAQDDPLAVLKERCLELCVIELDAVAEFAPCCLSDKEKEKYQPMGRLRRRSYLGARLALKRLSRKLGDGLQQTPPHAIHTHQADGVRPCCALPANGATIYCSASHSRRFAVAAAAEAPVGIDVEPVTGRAARCSRIFMSETERQLLQRTTLDREQAAVRIWSAKEAVAKAENIPLAEAWHRTEITDVESGVSRLLVDGRESGRVLHAAVDDSVFTLFVPSG